MKNRCLKFLDHGCMGIEKKFQFSTVKLYVQEAFRD